MAPGERALRQLGVPTDRLQPVSSLAKKACVQYEKGATLLCHRRQHHRAPDRQPG
jgi:hypothetical protein